MASSKAEVGPFALIGGGTTAEAVEVGCKLWYSEIVGVGLKLGIVLSLGVESRGSFCESSSSLEGDAKAVEIDCTLGVAKFSFNLSSAFLGLAPIISSSTSSILECPGHGSLSNTSLRHPEPAGKSRR